MTSTAQGTGDDPGRRSLGQRIYARLIKLFGPATITPPDDRRDDPPR